MTKQIYLTYDQWSLLGYYVMKGQKSIKKDEDGEATFSLDQVNCWEDEDYEISQWDIF